MKPASGKYAVLQSSLNGGSWKTVSGKTTNSNGDVSFTIKPPTVGSYRYRTVIGTVAGKILYITVKQPVTTVCDCTGSPTSGKKPLTVKFTDKSTGSPKSWSRNFGDGTTSTVKNPIHTYSRTGTFTVKLTVKYANGR
jgi:PKD repeat protein